MTEFAEEIRAFLIESHENVNDLDTQIVELEKMPADERGMASVFRTIHTLKGTSEFFGFHVIGSIAHLLESLLAQVREKARPLTEELVSLLLESLDAVKQVLETIERTNQEGDDRFEGLVERLSAAFQQSGKANASEMERPTRRGENRRHERSFPTTEAIRQEESAVSEMDPIEGTRASDHAARSTIRVDVALLDKMLRLVDDLASANSRSVESVKNPWDIPAERGNEITAELRECVMLARMQPIGVIWNKLPRAVRDVAAEMGKIIEIEMDGALTELDRSTIEAIGDPLTHMVRNACDHGIEVPQIRLAHGKSAHGTIVLRAFAQAGQVTVQISDDGVGIDPVKIKHRAVEKGLIRPDQATSMDDRAALRLIFLPGVSTAETVSRFSGRGVGMDVVKTNIERIDGTVDVASRVGVGTTVTIRIPPRMSRQRN